MPDLLTHTLLNTVLPFGRLRRRELAVFVFGGVLPDLVSRLPSLLLSRLVQPWLLHRGWDLDWVVGGFEALHVPLGLLTVSVTLVSLAPGVLLGGLDRVRVGKLILGGGAVHLMIDLFQHHLRPGYPYLFPFSLRPCEVGWFDADTAFISWPVLLPLAVFAWSQSPRER